jgi:hypothetical protein
MMPNRPIKTLEDRVTHVLSECLNDNAPLGEEKYRWVAKAVLKELSVAQPQVEQRHDFTGQDAQRNSQDGNSVVLSADEWDAYRADLNTYSQILALLGMEEEGDPVLAVKLLMQVKHD